jgi:hypothetical protein
MLSEIPFVGSRVRVTADQNYEVTWNDGSDVGREGLLVSINWQFLAFNLHEKNVDCAPFGVVVDDCGEPELIHVAEVEAL